MERLATESSTPYLFAKEPILNFRCARSRCPDCQAPLKVKKTRFKSVCTLHVGGFRAHETLLQCDQCSNPSIYAAESLSRLVASGCRFGYDVMVFVGKAFFLRHCRVQDIIDQLRSRNVPISSSEVEYLAKKFVVYLALAHRHSARGLKKVFGRKGGYILHLDGTCESGGPMLMSSLDSISRIVLGNIKVPSEKAQEIIPFLEGIKRSYGTPLAAVHDMGAGILAAVKNVFPDIPDFICHFHFLRDAGKDLLEKDYDGIRKSLRKHGVTQKLLNRTRRLKNAMDKEPDLVERFSRGIGADSLCQESLDRFPLLCAYSLIQWALEGKTQGQGYGFPFDRPLVEFARRLVLVHERLEHIKQIHLRGQWRDNIPLHKLSCELQKICTDKALRKSLQDIDAKIEVFDQLRRAMRIAQEGGSRGLNSGSEQLAMGPIEKALKKFRDKITARPDYDRTPAWKTMIAQIDKYWDKLFADPITLTTPDGPVRIQPQRTNNIMERFFRDFRRGARRRSGHNSISKFLQSMIADTPLVKNLENPEYMKILLNGRATLEERFADIDIETVRAEFNASQVSPEKVPRKIREMIAAPEFPITLCRFFENAA